MPSESGSLIDAHGFDRRVRHQIPTASKVLEVEPIRLDGEPAKILAEITRIASGVLDHGSDRSTALSGTYSGLA